LRETPRIPFGRNCHKSWMNCHRGVSECKANPAARCRNMLIWSNLVGGFNVYVYIYITITINAYYTHIYIYIYIYYCISSQTVSKMFIHCFSFWTSLKPFGMISSELYNYQMSWKPRHADEEEKRCKVPWLAEVTWTSHVSVDLIQRSNVERHIDKVSNANVATLW
jgi:hypothetical protein